MYLYPGGHNELIPIDIDVHKLNYNERLNLPEHYHFEFRYLFMIDRISDIEIDNNKLSDYKWISIEELSHDVNYGIIAKKIMKLLGDKKRIQEKSDFER